MYHRATLPNGLTLVAEQHAHVRSVSLGAWVKIGSSLERPQINGVSHMIEHMVFKGTETRNPLEIATVLESLGGDLNAYTDRELTCYHATVLREHIGVALDVVSDLITRPTFPKDQLERERKVLLQELSMIEDSPDDWINDVFFQTVWKEQPLGRTVIGSKQTIQGISRAQLLDFFRNHYRPENIVIAVSGNVDFEVFKAECERYFVFPERKPRAGVTKRPVSRYQARKKALLAATEQTHFLLGFEGIGFRDPYRFDALILSFFLGGGMSSRLFQEVREKAGLAYSVECDYIPFTDTGLFTISASLAPKSLKQCFAIIGREIMRLRNEKLTPRELDIVKGQLRGTILLNSDQMETRQESLGRNEIVFGRYVSVEEVIAEIDRVSADRVQELANRIFVPEKESIVALSRQKPKNEWLTVF